MYKIKRLKKNVKNYLFDHPMQKEALKNFYMLILTALSGLIFAFGFNTFISPNFEAITKIIGVDAAAQIPVKHLASLGASGTSQILMTLMKIADWRFIADETHFNIIYWCCYFVINLPLFFLGFCKVGKKFAVFSLINVGCASGFGILLKSTDPNNLLNQLAALVADQTVARVLFAGICTGVACGIAYVIDTTAGGIDIIAFYISERKSVQVGKWSTTLNFFVVTIFTLLSTVPLSSAFETNSEFGHVEFKIAFIIFLFTFLYMIVVNLVVDTINTKNKKYDVQIVTPNYNLSQVIIAAVPRGCTIMDGKGGYSGKPVYVIHVSVSNREVKKVVKLVNEIDPQAFVNVIPMKQVYGKFYRKPIE